MISIPQVRLCVFAHSSCLGISCFRARQGQIQGPGPPYVCSFSYMSSGRECRSYSQGVLLWLGLLHHLCVRAPSMSATEPLDRRIIGRFSPSLYMLITSPGKKTMPQGLRAWFIGRENFFLYCSGFCLVSRRSRTAFLIFIASAMLVSKNCTPSGQQVIPPFVHGVMSTMASYWLWTNPSAEDGSVTNAWASDFSWILTSFVSLAWKCRTLMETTHSNNDDRKVSLFTWCSPRLYWSLWTYVSGCSSSTSTSDNTALPHRGYLVSSSPSGLDALQDASWNANYRFGLLYCSFLFSFPLEPSRSFFILRAWSIGFILCLGYRTMFIIWRWLVITVM